MVTIPPVTIKAGKSAARRTPIVGGNAARFAAYQLAPEGLVIQGYCACIGEFACDSKPILASRPQLMKFDPDQP
jgi:hypothetical protein